jgi:hypothetical protein
LHPPRPSTWWDRNWKWFVPAGCLSALLLLLAVVGGLLSFAFGMMKASDAYKHALAEAQLSPAVVAALGEPLKGGLLVSGTLHVEGLAGSADLSIPISGPKGAGTLFLKATKSQGNWTFDALEMEVERTRERIDLLAEGDGTT